MAQLVINNYNTISIDISLFFLDYRYNIKLLKIKSLDYKAIATSIVYLLKKKVNTIIIKIKKATKIAQLKLAIV